MIIFIKLNSKIRFLRKFIKNMRNQWLYMLKTSFCNSSLPLSGHSVAFRKNTGSDDFLSTKKNLKVKFSNSKNLLEFLFIFIISESWMTRILSSQHDKSKSEASKCFASQTFRCKDSIEEGREFEAKRKNKIWRTRFYFNQMIL